MTRTITICSRCHAETTDAMTSAIGPVCPDCYDRVADGDVHPVSRMQSYERGLHLSADGKTFIVAIRYEDSLIRADVKALGFRWNATDKVWTRPVGADAAKIARALLRTGLPVHDQRIAVLSAATAEMAPSAATTATREVSFRLEDAPYAAAGGRKLETVTVTIPAATPTDLQSELRAAGPQIAAEIAKVSGLPNVRYDSAYVWSGTPYAGLNIMSGRKSEHQVKVYPA